MWLDYGIYLTTGLVLAAVVGLIVAVIRNRSRRTRLILVGLLTIGLVGTALARPERFRTMGEDLTVVVLDGTPQTEVDLIGTCLSVFRRFGPLSFIAGTALLPDPSWNQGPYSGCDAMGIGGVIELPDLVESGEWMLCDYSTCHRLVRA